MKPWGYARPRDMALSGRLYCVTPECEAFIGPDGIRRYDHIDGCETEKIESRLAFLESYADSE